MGGNISPVKTEKIADIFHLFFLHFRNYGPRDNKWTSPKHGLSKKKGITCCYDSRSNLLNGGVQCVASQHSFR